MAQILVCSVPTPGHFDPMLAICRRLAQDGHSIVFYTAATFRDKVEQSGFEFVCVPGKANFDYRRWDDYFPSKDQVPPGIDRANLVRRIIFSDTLEDQNRGLIQLLQTHSIDIILVDSLFFGILPLLLGARNERPPVVCCGVNPLRLVGVDAGPMSPVASTPVEHEEVARTNRDFLSTSAPFTDSINARLCDLGLPQLPGSPFDVFYTLPDLVFQLSVPGLEFVPSDAPRTLHLVGPILPKSKGFEEPSWWHDLDDARPVVLVTQGTLANNDFTELIEPTLRALEGEDVLVIAATGQIDAALPYIPNNVRVTPFVPFDQILPRVSVFVTNAGYGGVNQALAAGVPTVAAGVSEDKAFVSERLAWSGAGINLATSRPSESQILFSVREILGNPAYRQRALELREEIALHDALDSIAAGVESLISQQLAIK